MIIGKQLFLHLSNRNNYCTTYNLSKSDLSQSTKYGMLQVIWYAGLIGKAYRMYGLISNKLSILKIDLAMGTLMFNFDFLNSFEFIWDIKILAVKL